MTGEGLGSFDGSTTSYVCEFSRAFMGEKTTLETSGEDSKAHSKRAEKITGTLVSSVFFFRRRARSSRVASIWSASSRVLCGQTAYVLCFTKLSEFSTRISTLQA